MKPRRMAHFFMFSFPIDLYNIGDYRLKLFISTPRMVMSDTPQIGTGLSKKGTPIGHQIWLSILKWRLFSFSGQPSYDARYILRYAEHHSKDIFRSLTISYLLCAAQKPLSPSSLPTDWQVTIDIVNTDGKFSSRLRNTVGSKVGVMLRYSMPMMLIVRKWTRWRLSSWSGFVYRYLVWM